MLPVSQILEKTTVQMDGKNYMKLVRARGVKVGNTVQYLTIDTSRVPLELFPGIDEHNFAVESLYSTIREKYNVFPGTASIQITPLLADGQAAEIFSIAPNTPLIQATGSAFSVTGVEIEKVNVIYGPAMDFNLTVEIGN
jgi:DNA-binding GntR family transcriptional regulator